VCNTKPRDEATKKALKRDPKKKEEELPFEALPQLLPTKNQQTRRLSHKNPPKSLPNKRTKASRNPLTYSPSLPPSLPSPPPNSLLVGSAASPSGVCLPFRLRHPLLPVRRRAATSLHGRAPGECGRRLPRGPVPAPGRRRRLGQFLWPPPLPALELLVRAFLLVGDFLRGFSH
jgi:hypothetical protein